MAKKKYDPDDMPLLAEGYARKGLSDKQIWKNIGIGKSSFYEYQQLYSDFSDAIKRGRRPVDVEVENALLKRALGYDYVEKTTEVDVTGGGQGANPTKIRSTTKHMAGDVGAMAFWLKNRKNSDWKDKQSHELSGPDGKPIETENTQVVIYIPANGREK